MDFSVLYHAAEHLSPPTLVDSALLIGHIQQICDLTGPQHGGVVHVEGQPGGAAVPADLLRDPHVIGVAGSHAAVLLGHAQGQVPALPQCVEVCPRKRRMTVGFHRAGLEQRAELGDGGDHLVASQSRLRGSHGSGLRGGPGGDSDAFVRGNAGGGCHGSDNRTKNFLVNTVD